MTSTAEFCANELDERYVPVVRLWTLRALVRAKVSSAFVGEKRFQDERVACLLGWTEAAPADYCAGQALIELQEKLSTLEREGPQVPSDAVLARNIYKLAERVGLSEIERDILHLCFVQRHHDEFTAVLEMAGSLTNAALFRLIAECLGRPVHMVRAALTRRAKLYRAAMLLVDGSDRHRFAEKLRMPGGLAEGLMQERHNLLELFHESIAASVPARIELDSFAYLGDDIKIMRGLLDGAMRARTPGVNVLIHGRPGIGKTELVRALVAACGLQLFEIPCDDACGSPRDGSDRLASFRLAQSLLGGASGCVLLLDEVEDLFTRAGNDFEGDGNTSGTKAWVNFTLEHNPVPTFWVTNHVRSIDPAHRRRFDLVLQLEVPPVAVRRAVIDRHADALSLPEAWRERAASHQDMPPAVVERAARVGLLVCSAEPELTPQNVVGRVMNHALAALGRTPLPDEDACAMPGIDYRLDLLNADCDVASLRDGLLRVGEGRLCLYGPPGTGKTEFGRHAARWLDRPLIIRRASDLLSPYVGAAERNIARMFEEARQQGAVLMVDEADSLLRERRLAQRSWEVTLVNEMLTQMESFRGVFIASTNLLDTLDEASLRRFDMRVRLGYLGPQQAREMFVSLATALQIEPDELSVAAVARLAVLTPGDFAAVARGARLDAPTTALALYARLKQACDGKRDGSRRPIGFAA